jgi:hypothetical protein
MRFKRTPDEIGVDAASAQASAGREITLRGLAATLAHGWRLLVLVTVLCLLATAVALKMWTPIYTATLVVAPPERDLSPTSRPPPHLDHYATFATLAQTPERLELVSPLDRYIALLGSAALATRLEEEHSLLRRVFRDQWDATTETWRPPLIENLQGGVREFFGFPGWRPPDPPQLAEWLQRRIRVTRPGGTALRRVELDHAEPEFAVELLALLHASTDQMLREQALARMRRQVAHLEVALSRAERVERRTRSTLCSWTSTGSRHCSRPRHPMRRRWCDRQRRAASRYRRRRPWFWNWRPSSGWFSASSSCSCATSCAPSE